MNPNNEEEDITVCITDKPIDVPIQNVDIPTMNNIEKIEKSYFKNKIQDKRKVFFRGVYRYQNPIHKENPLNEGERDPEIYAINIGKDKDTIATGYSNGEIHLYDKNMFDIDMGTKLDKVKMSQINPSVNFVGRANTNNGITGRVDSIPNIKPYEAGNMTLSLGGEYLGSCFIQPDYFYTSQNVVVLMPKWDMPFVVKQFIATMIFKESRTYYKAFIDELNRHIKTDFSFYLPVTPEGIPDWDFMAKYMQDTINESATCLKSLSAALT